jgi:Rrf2 family nitric oxide-sensitive transcriptional repressor
MRLTVYTDFALRVLIYVAVHPEPKPTIAEIAASYGVSRNHLMKVVYELGVAGYLETSRGKNGGLRLARPPQAIGLGELVRRTEPDLDLVECFSADSGRCAITPACKLRGVLHQAKAAFLRVLDGYTLADLVEDPAALRALLDRQPHQDAAPPPSRRVTAPRRADKP